MKNVLLILMFLVFTTVARGETSNPVPSVGWPREQVIELLGEPEGLIRTESMEVLYYDRGLVTLRDGRVESASLVSREDALRLRLERERLAAMQAQDRAERRRQLYEAGQRERDRILADPNYSHLSADHRIRIWESFTRRYPDVGVTDLLLAARAQWEAEEERVNLLRRLAALEDRTRMAEQRARDAEAAARSARYSYSSGWVVRYPWGWAPPTAGPNPPWSPRYPPQTNERTPPHRGVSIRMEVRD
ncbi:MAG: hypothetical protein U1E27_12590 [Kiritimatiellia bacterium]|nr:hypothetical protein [Kiritimatiellia bacterium]